MKVPLFIRLITPLFLVAASDAQGALITSFTETMGTVGRTFTDVPFTASSIELSIYEGPFMAGRFPSPEATIFDNRFLNASNIGETLIADALNDAQFSTFADFLTNGSIDYLIIGSYWEPAGKYGSGRVYDENELFSGLTSTDLWRYDVTAIHLTLLSYDIVEDVAGSGYFGDVWEARIEIFGEPIVTPLPSALWLFGSGLLTLFGVQLKTRKINNIQSMGSDSLDLTLS